MATARGRFEQAAVWIAVDVRQSDQDQYEDGRNDDAHQRFIA